MSTATKGIIITRAFPSILKSISFTLNDIRNPSSEKKTGSFKIQVLDSLMNIKDESNSAQFQITPQRDDLYVVQIQNANLFVGEYGNASVLIQTGNGFPKGSIISMMFPKWNPDSLFAKESFFMTSSGLLINCAGVQNINKSIKCSLTIGSEYDTLKIENGFPTNDTKPQTFIQISIETLRNPPSTQPIFLKEVAILDKDGFYIESTSQAQIRAIQAAIVPSENFIIQPQDNFINTLTQYDISIRLKNPAPVGSQIYIFFPSELSLTNENGDISYLQKVTMTGRQSSSKETGSFKVQIWKDQIYPIEFRDTNLTLRFQAKEIKKVEMSWENKLTFKENGINFTFDVPNIINGQDQLLDNGDCSIDESLRRISLKKYIDFKLTSPSTVVLILKGFINPMSEEQTKPFYIQMKDQLENTIYYYNQSNLNFTAEASEISKKFITSGSKMTNDETYYTFHLEIPQNIQIPQSSKLEIQLPSQITIGKLQSLQCYGPLKQNVKQDCFFNESDNKIVFNSIFNNQSLNQGQNIVIYVENLLNPFSTQETDSFKLYFKTVTNFNILKITQGYNIQMEKGYPFQFVEVSSYSKINFAISDYTFKIGMELELTNNEYILITPPPQIRIPTSSQLLNCEGISDFLVQSLPCLQIMGQIQLQVKFIDKVNLLKKGDQLSFIVHDLQNPLSIKQTDSFEIKTLSSNFKYVKQEQNSNIKIQNQEPALITIATVLPQNANLGQQSQFIATFMTNTGLPRNSKIQINIPTEIKYEDNLLCQPLSGLPTDILCSYNSLNHSFIIILSNETQVSSNQEIKLSLGVLLNPTSPLITESFQIRTFTQDNYLIEEVSNGLQISQDCEYPCKTCGLSPKICTSCQLNQIYKFFHDYSCVDNCPSGTFNNQIDHCLPCSSDCSECQGKEDYCTKCANEHLIVNPENGKCVDECSDGYFQNQELNQCQKCEAPCSTCVDKSYCTTCNSPSLYILQGQCISLCPSNSFIISAENKICEQCASTCKRCSENMNYCTECYEKSDNPLLYKNQCLATCPKGTQERNDGNFCIEVSENIAYFPFLILFVVVLCIIGPYWIKHKEFNFKDSIICTLSLICFFNWIFILALVIKGRYWQSSIIVAYCLIAQMILNAIWIFLYFKRIRIDNGFHSFMKDHQKRECSIVTLSLLFSFQLFRLNLVEYSFKCLEMVMPQMYDNLYYRKTLVKLSLIQIGSTLCPMLIQNIYNLFYTNAAFQLFFEDIESLIMTSILIILLLVDVRKMNRQIKIDEELKIEQLKNDLSQNATPRITSLKDLTEFQGDFLNNSGELDKFEKMMQHYIQLKKTEIKQTRKNIMSSPSFNQASYRQGGEPFISPMQTVLDFSQHNRQDVSENIMNTSRSGNTPKNLNNTFSINPNPHEYIRNNTKKTPNEMPVGVQHNDLSLDKHEDKEIEEFHVQFIKDLGNIPTQSQKDIKTREDDVLEAYIVPLNKDSRNNFIPINFSPVKSYESPDQNIIINDKVLQNFKQNNLNREKRVIGAGPKLDKSQSPQVTQGIFSGVKKSKRPTTAKETLNSVIKVQNINDQKWVSKGEEDKQESSIKYLNNELEIDQNLESYNDNLALNIIQYEDSAEQLSLGSFPKKVNLKENKENQIKRMARVAQVSRLQENKESLKGSLQEVDSRVNDSFENIQKKYSQMRPGKSNLMMKRAQEPKINQEIDSINRTLGSMSDRIDYTKSLDRSRQQQVNFYNRSRQSGFLRKTSEDLRNSPLASERSNQVQFQGKYKNPLKAKENEGSILSKSKRYQVGKTIMSSQDSSPLQTRTHRPLNEDASSNRESERVRSNMRGDFSERVINNKSKEQMEQEDFKLVLTKRQIQ